MSKKLVKAAALVLALMLVLSGCSLVVVNEERDNAEVVATVNDTKITKGEVMPTYNYLKDYYSYMYYYYFGNSDISSQLEGIRDEAVESHINKEIVLQKAAELGLNELSEEDLAAIAEDKDAAIEEYITDYAEAANAAELEGDAKQQAVLEYLGTTVEEIEQSMTDTRIIEKVRENVIADVEVTDEELQAAYDEKVAADEENFTASSYNYEMGRTNGSAVYWNPEGYRLVKHVELSYTDEQKQQLNAINNELDQIAEELEALETAAEEPAEEATEETEEVAEEEKAEEETEETAEAAEEAEEEAEPEEAPKTKEELEARKAELEAELEKLNADILDSFKEVTDAVYEQMEQSDDFDAMIQMYNEDPGMFNDATKDGYYVSENSVLWDPAFTEAAMKLEKVGDISDIVMSSAGLHIIRYEADVTAGAVPFDEVKDTLAEEKLAQKQDATYDAAYDSWYAAAKITKNPGKLAD